VLLRYIHSTESFWHPPRYGLRLNEQEQQIVKIFNFMFSQWHQLKDKIAKTMDIIKISPSNFDSYKTELIEINDAFLKELGISKQRSAQEKETILRNMIKANSPTTLLAAKTGNKLIGMTYFNLGTGYSCGGDYLWLNSIYIRPEEQQKGYGSNLLKYVQQWAKENQITLFVSSRDQENEKSRKLFENAGFKQSEIVWMSMNLKE